MSPHPEIDIVEALHARVRLAEVDQPFRQIDGDDASLRPDSLGGRQSRPAASAANIEDRLTLTQAEALDGPPPEAMPERADGMVKVIRRSVVSGGGFCFRLVEFTHWA